VRFLAGILWFALGVVLLQLISGGQFDSIFDFIDVSSFLIFVFSITAMVIITNRSALFLSAVKSLFVKRHKLITEQAVQAARLFKLLRKTVWYTAVVGTMVGVVLMMRNLQDMNILAANMALSLLSVFYAALINLIFINPAIAIFEGVAAPEQNE
jgi:flagellar motor component MotA